MTTRDPFLSLRDRAPVLSPEVLQKVRADHEAAPPQAKSLSRRARLALTFAATFFVLITLSASSLLHGQFEVLGWGFFVSLLVVGVVLSPAMPGKRPDRPRITLSLRRFLLGLILALLAMFFIESADEFSPGIHAPARMASTVKCAVHGLVRGGLGLGLLLGIWRRTDPFSPRLSAALLGLAAGLLGVLATTLACPNHEGWHLMFGHALVVALTAGLGFLLGERFLSP
jgi:hypothetical protein